MGHESTGRAGLSLVIATTNRGKLEELRAMLADLPVQVLSLADVGAEGITVVEDGTTFEENAAKKAFAIAAATTMLTLADDSGLEVDALGGEPGVRSARFAHERATDAENNAALLEALAALSEAGATPERLTARFRCVLALVDPYAAKKEPLLVEGRCEGAIVRAPRGKGGFGYDPLFLVAGTDKTMAELSAEEKNERSHRAQAFRRLRPALEKVLLAREERVRKVLG